MSVTLFKSSSATDSYGERGDSDERNDKFLRALRQANFTSQIIPVVSFDFCNLDILWRELQNYQHCDGLIFTSPRCVESLERAVNSQDCESQSKWDTELKGLWIDKCIYCVGPATVEAASNFFSPYKLDGKKMFQSEAGNSESLGHKILEVAKQQQIKLPLLYPCGNLKTDKLGTLLDQESIPYKTITVYMTVKNPELEGNPCFTQGASDNTSDAKMETSICVFFSPSGVNFTMPHLKNVEDKKFVALGPTTREALGKIQGIPPENIYQCTSPTPEGLLDVLRSLS